MSHERSGGDITLEMLQRAFAADIGDKMTDFTPKFIAADWMPKDRILAVGTQPDRREFTSDDEFFREWARRSAVITNIGTEDTHEP